MIRGNSFKLFVISTIITHKETVIRIEPPRNEAAPSRAYLKKEPNIKSEEGKKYINNYVDALNQLINKLLRVQQSWLGPSYSSL